MKSAFSHISRAAEYFLAITHADRATSKKSIEGNIYISRHPMEMISISRSTPFLSKLIKKKGGKIKITQLTLCQQTMQNIFKFFSQCDKFPGMIPKVPNAQVSPWSGIQYTYIINAGVDNFNPWYGQRHRDTNVKWLLRSMKLQFTYKGQSGLFPTFTLIRDHIVNYCLILAISLFYEGYLKIKEFRHPHTVSIRRVSFDILPT